MRYKLLSKAQRERIRQIAGESYAETNGDEVAAKRLASQRVRDEFKSAILTYIIIRIAIALAVALITHWLLKGLQGKPAPEYQPDEPGYSHE